MNDLVLRWIMVLPSLWLGLCAHEAAHAWAALKLGDSTARDQGRLSLYPPRHLDILGSMLIPLVLLAVFKGFVYGWAKPSPVDPAKLRRPKRDFSLVALSGPGANLLLALLVALLARAAHGHIGGPLVQVLAWGILVNVMLAFFNLLPLPGLDGIKALFAFLPDRLCYRLNRAEPWIFLFLLLLVYAGAMDWVFFPVASLTGALCLLGGLPFPVGHV